VLLVAMAKEVCFYYDRVEQGDHRPASPIVFSGGLETIDLTSMCMTDTTKREYLPHEWMTFVDAVRHVAMANEFDDDPIDDIARGLDEVRSALIEGKIPVEWVGENSHGRGFNPYSLFGLDEPRSDLEWVINYGAERSEIPDPRPAYLSMNYIVELRRLRELRLLKSRVLELWPGRCGEQPNDPNIGAKIHAVASPLSTEQLEDRVRQILRAMYKDSQPNMTVVEQKTLEITRAHRELNRVNRDFIRVIAREEEFRLRRRPRGNSRKPKI
jgi:hypothetical protein